MANRYAFNIEWSEEDQEYIATCPSFPGLSAFGATEEEALKEGKIALAGFIETFKENNTPLPEPLVRDSYSGKLQLRLPKTLHRLAVQMAAREGVSLNTYIADAVRTRVTMEQVGQPMLQEMQRYLNETRLTIASAVTARQTVTPLKTLMTTNEVPERAIPLLTSGECGNGK